MALGRGGLRIDNNVESDNESLFCVPATEEGKEEEQEEEEDRKEEEEEKEMILENNSTRHGILIIDDLAGRSGRTDEVPYPTSPSASYSRIKK